jgi:hypothetical protein
MFWEVNGHSLATNLGAIQVWLITIKANGFFSKAGYSQDGQYQLKTNYVATNRCHMSEV